MTSEAAFMAFFCQQGSAQQRAATASLKNRGWRYHTELQTWFARAGPSGEHADAFEAGTMDPVA